MKAKVFVTLRKSVLDPQGKAIHSALDSMGFSAVESVRCGKMIEISFKPGIDGGAAERELKSMCEKLLANTVIEDYCLEMEK